MKKYAVVVDVSPTEQLNTEEDIKCMAFLFGLNSPESFDKVGSNTIPSECSLKLKKWNKAKSGYKRNLVSHLHHLKNEGNVLFGVYISSDKVIRLIGTEVNKRVFGKIPKPKIDHNNRAFIDMTTIVDEEKITFTILWNDMLILNWYYEGLMSLYKTIEEVNSDSNEEIYLDVLIDKLPGDSSHNKAKLLNYMCQKMSGNKLRIAGVPEKSDHLQRDLLTDNIAGLNREIIRTKNPTIYGDVSILFSPSRVILK